MFKSKESSQQQNQMEEQQIQEQKPTMNQEQQMEGNNTDMFQGAQASWKKTVGMRKTLNHLHQFIYQHLKKTFKEKIVDTNKLKFFTYITNKGLHTGVSINEFDFHIGRKHGMTIKSRENIVNEYVKILGNPLKDKESLKSKTYLDIKKEKLNFTDDNIYLINEVLDWNENEETYFKKLNNPKGELENAYNQVISDIRQKSKSTFLKIFNEYMNFGLVRGGKTKKKKSKKNSTRRKH